MVLEEIFEFGKFFEKNEKVLENSRVQSKFRLKHNNLEPMSEVSWGKNWLNQRKNEGS